MELSREHLSFLDAAYQVLLEERSTLTAREIVSAATKRGLLATQGATPWKTMNARLSGDILSKKEDSRFMRVGSGRFALSEWKDKIQRWTAPRRVLAPFDEDILVFDYCRLREFVPQDGFLVGRNIFDDLVSVCYPMRRRDAEDNFSVIQLVSAYIIQDEDKILTYKRSKRLPEKRLHGVYSAVFGGHIISDDLMPLFRFGGADQALSLLVRELHEEISFKNLMPQIDFCGVLYDPRTEVSRQHLAIVFRASLKDRDFAIGERGFLTNAKFETKLEMMGRISEFENWSELLIREVI